MNNKSITLTILFSLLSYGFLEAQDAKVNKQVEVIKSYSPTIGKGIKLDIEPSMEKTIVLEAPKFDYSIAYKPQRYIPNISTLESFDVTNFEKKKTHNLYADLAFGYPLNTRLNAIYSTNPKNNLYAAVALRHEGFFGKLVNDYDQKLSGTTTTNSIGGMLAYRKNRLLFDANVGYAFNLYNQYGYFSPVNDVLFSDQHKKQLFHNFDFDISVGTDFGYNNKWDAKFYTSAIYLNDNYRTSESDIFLGGLVSKGFKDGRHRVSLALEYMHIAQGVNNTPPYPSVSKPTGAFDGMNIMPSYRYHTSTFTAEVGLKMYYTFNPLTSSVNNTDKSVFLPQLLLQYHTKRFSPYVAIKGDYQYNSFASLSAINPYLISGFCAPNGYNLDFVIGLKGSASTWLNYNLEGGYQRADNVVMFKNVLDGNVFDVLTNNFDNFIFKAEFSVLMMERLSVNASYDFVSYGEAKRGVDMMAYGLPEHTLNLSMFYKATERWSFELSGELQSSRTFLGDYLTNDGSPLQHSVTNSVPTTFNLGLGAGYAFSKTFTATLDLSNILNQKLYQYNHYRGVGFCAMIGIKAKF